VTVWQPGNAAAALPRKDAANRRNARSAARRVSSSRQNKQIVYQTAHQKRALETSRALFFCPLFTEETPEKFRLFKNGEIVATAASPAEA
jgi:hypothetical protein